MPNAFVYRYDGSFQGFLCCVAECFRDRRLPLQIQLLDEPQETLFPIKVIDADPVLAQRVEQSIPAKISREVWQMTRRAFLSCMEDKELHLIRFLLLGYKYGAGVTGRITNDDVHTVNAALLALQNEAHFHVELLRFTDLGGFLAAEISPKNNVLPLIAGHFHNRFPGENLMIFDREHGLGFVSRSSGRQGFFRADSLTLPPPGAEEEEYRRLWKRFYNSVAVEGRKNEKLRQTHMPKRYWAGTVELRDAL